jgi:uncharacterized membrane protein
MLALLIAVLLSALIAWLVVIALGRFLESVRFNDRLNQWGLTSIAEWSPRESPALLVTRAVGWFIVLLGLILGLAAFDATLTSNLAFNLFAYVPNVLAAILVLIVGFILARYAARGILIEGVNLNLQYARFLSIGVKWMILVITIAIALEHLQIGSGIVPIAFAILFGGIVFTLAISVGLGSRDLVRRSLERESERVAASDTEEPFRHL